MNKAPDLQAAGGKHDRPRGVTAHSQHPVRPECPQNLARLGIAVKEHGKRLQLCNSTFPPHPCSLYDLERIAQLREEPRFYTPFRTDEKDLVAAPPGKEFLGNRDAGKQMAAGPPSGNDEFHGSLRIRDE